MRGDALRVKEQPVGCDGSCADLLKSRFKANRVVFTLGKEIRISRGTVCLVGPEFKEQCAL
jgi:hypothetical protein